MFMNIRNKMEENERYPATLFFEGLGTLEIDFILKSPKKIKSRINTSTVTAINTIISSLEISFKDKV